MAEATILGLIQDLKTLNDTSSLYTYTFEEKSKRQTGYNYAPRRNLRMKIEELGQMLDFLRDLKMEDMSKLKYLMADFVEIAQDIADLDIHLDKYPYLDPETNIVENSRFGKLLMRLRDEIKMIKMRIMNFGVDEKNIGEEEEEVIVFGLEEDVKELVDKVILNKSYHYPFVTIKGMIGIGKTTFARLVYKHKEVVSQFERRAWVSFASDMSCREILLELIKQMVVGNEELIERDLLEEKDNRSLRQMLRQHLQGKRFIIVVDNLPKEMRLSYILQDLQDKVYGSRILCTSLHGRIYSTLSFYYNIDSSVSYIHEMRPLDLDKSWQLFLKTIGKFTSDDNKFSKDLERKGKEMLKKCWGLPMAIIDVGRQKAKQRLSGIEWEELFDSIDLDESLKKLEPMYDELDETLKACFLHMSLFKENAIMREEKLEQIWAASGVIKRTAINDRIVGKIGPCNVLLGQSTIQAVNELRFSYEVKRCRVHPLLHMLSRRKAEDGMGFEILSCNGNYRPSQSPRHRVVQCGRENFNHTMNQDKHLVSLIFHGGGGYLDAASQSYWMNFEVLKILDMEDFGVKTLSESIGILIELRYLGLRNNYIREIPHSLGGLKKLEVLDIDLNCMVEVPDIICEMGSLCDLHMSNVICRKPLQIDKLKNLKTLTYISIYDWTYEVSDLVKRIGLEKLGIEEVDENMEVGKFFASLAKLGNPGHLILKGFRFRSMPCLDEIKRMSPRILKLEGLLTRLPSADKISTNLSSLALVNTCLDEDPMPVLEKLDNLERLKLRNAYTGREMVVRDGFRMLQLLRINELWNLRKVQVGKGGMQVLKELEIKNCPRLDTLPEEIRSMKYLKKFKVVTNRTSPPIAFKPAPEQPAEKSNQEAKGNQARQKTVIPPMRMGRTVRTRKKHARFLDDNFN